MAIGGLYIELFIVIFYIRIAVVSELYHTSIFLHIRQFEKSKGYKNSLNACPQLSSAQNEMSPARMGRNPSSDQDMSTCFYLKTHGKKNRLVTWKTMRPMRPNPLMPIFVASAAAKIEAPNWKTTTDRFLNQTTGKNNNNNTFKKALKRWRCRYVLDSPARLEQENLSAGSFLTFPISMPIPGHQIWH